MDIFAHALWTGAAAVSLRARLKRPIRVGWCLAWGVLPDLVSFLIPAVVRIGRWLTGASQTVLPDGRGPRFDWVWPIYNCSHSAVVFALAFGAICLHLQRPPSEMLGWALHIAIDIFTHRGWFAVRFLWPLSDYHVDGLPWETPWFPAANWVFLTTIWLVMIVRMRRDAPDWWPVYGEKGTDGFSLRKRPGVAGRSDLQPRLFADDPF